MEQAKNMNEEVEAQISENGQTDELKNIIEAAIMVSEEPLTIDRMLSMFTDATKPERATIRELLLELEQDYERRGFELKRIDQGYRLQTREEYSPWLARLSAGRPPRYSRALLETLAIIAYRQPVTRGEIEEIRGVAVSTDIIRTLQERSWVRQVGVRDVPGKPALFATTREFLEYFNLEGLNQLPSLQEIRDMDTIAAELNMTLPLEASEENSDQEDDKDHSDDSESADNQQIDLSEEESDGGNQAQMEISDDNPPLKQPDQETESKEEKINAEAADLNES